MVGSRSERQCRAMYDARTPPAGGALHISERRAGPEVAIVADRGACGPYLSVLVLPRPPRDRSFEDGARERRLLAGTARVSGLMLLLISKVVFVVAAPLFRFGIHCVIRLLAFVC